MSSTAIGSHPDVARICSLVIDREPTTLGELEDILGFSIPRDPKQPWKARAKDPVRGIDHVFAAFVGPSVEAIAADPDPALDDLGLGAPDIDCGELAVALLGIPHGRDRFARWRRGEGELAVQRGYLSWQRTEPHGTRDSDEDAQLVANLAALLDRNITFDSIAQIFGLVRVEGRSDMRVARGPTWSIGVPIAQKEPYNVTIRLEPPLPCEPVFAALGWHDIVIDRDQQHTVVAIDARSAWYPMSSAGFLVSLAIHEPDGIELGAPYAVVARQRRLFTHWIYLTRSLHAARVTP